MTTETELSGQHKVWQSENPLRVWRKDNRITLHQTAALMDCSVSTVQLWEAGANIPSGKNFEKLKKAIGPNTESRWMRWHSRRPTPTL